MSRFTGYREKNKNGKILTSVFHLEGTSSSELLGGSFLMNWFGEYLINLSVTFLHEKMDNKLFRIYSRNCGDVLDINNNRTYV